MIKDIKVKDYDVHVEESRKGTIITYTKHPVHDESGKIIEPAERYAFQPLLSKHQQLYDIYRNIKENELTPLELLQTLSTFRYQRNIKNQLTCDYKDGELVYMKFESSDKYFESDGHSTLIVGRTPHQRGMLIQHYLVNTPTEFPTETDLDVMFQADSMQKFIDNFNAWLPEEPEKGDPELKKEQTPEEIQAQTAQA